MTTGMFSEPTIPQPRILSRGALSTAESKRKQNNHTIHNFEYNNNIFRPGTSAGAENFKMRIQNTHNYQGPEHFRAKSMVQGSSLFYNVPG